MADTDNKGLERPAHDSSNWDTPLNSNFTIIDKSLGTTLNVAAVTPGATLTADECQNAIIHFTGVLTANTTYKIPGGMGGFWIIRNDCTTSGGDWTFSIGGDPVGGQTVEVPVGQTRTVGSNGTSTPNIRLADVYGVPGQVIYNKAGNPDGDVDFTFDGTDLKVPRIELKDGSKTDPVIKSDTATKGTGIYFYDPDTDKGIAFATDELNRFLINSKGAFGLGDTPVDFGIAGQFLKSMSDTANPIWANIGLKEIETIVNPGTANFVFNTIDHSPSPYKFFVFVLENVNHNAGSDRTFGVGAGSLSSTISNAVSSNAEVSGMVIVHIPSGVGFSVTGQSPGTATYCNGFVTNISGSSSQVRIGILSPGSAIMGPGKVHLLGIYG